MTGVRSLTSALDLAPAFIAVLRGPHHVFEYHNAAYRRFVGTREVIGLSVCEALPELEAQGFLKTLDRVYATGEAFVGEELRVLLQPSPGATQEERYVDLVYQPLPGLDGAAAGIMVHGVDATARVRATRDMRRLMQHSLDVICSIDGEGRFVWVSAAAEAVWGYTPAELVGKRYMDFVHPDDHERTTAAAAAIRSGEPVRNFENRYVRRDGTLVPMLWSSTWSEEDGLMMSVAHDRTEAKQKERELIAAQERYEQGILQLNAELGKARTFAESADRAKSQFLAVMSHEIRTPLSSVLGFGDLLLDTPLDEMQRDFVARINESGEALLRLINDILDLSKIEAGGVEIEQRAFDPRKLIAAVNHTFQPRAVAKDLVLGANVEVAVPRLMVGDEHRIRQVLSNYISNAIKFTDHGSVVVSLHVEPAPTEPVPSQALDAGAEKVLLRVSVRDTGIGIPADRMDRLFKTFSQVDASTTRKFGGTGLGLAIVKRLAELMGGEAWAESVVGEGSVFHFTALLGTTALKSTTRGPMQSAYPELDRGMRILLAEDTESNQTLIQATLTQMGLTADLVPDGLQAVAAVVAAAEAGAPYAVVLMDVQMPVMDGIVATKAIRVALPEHQQPRIIAVTADALVGDRERCVRAGMNDYLSKPFKPTKLAEAIVRV